MRRTSLEARPTRRQALVVAGVLVLLLGAGLRLVGANWDDGEHLHPDERYISTVADNTYWPGGIEEYFDVERSRLSPYTTEKTRDYIYGTLPLFATKLVAAALGQDGYGRLYLVGRRLAAVLDTLTIVLVFLIALLLLEDLGRERAAQGALLAAALYAFTVTAIQHAHFFTTDSWLVFFGMLTFLLALWSLRRGVGPNAPSPSPVVLLLGASLGLTVACKVSGALVAVPVALALAARSVLVSGWAGPRGAGVRLVAESGAVGLTAYVVFRLVSPYTFARSNWLDLSLNEWFRNALDNQARATSSVTLTPPAYQWLLSARVWDPLENLVVWQLGIPLGITAIVGIAVLGVGIVTSARAGRRQLLRDPERVATLSSRLMVLAFVLTVFFYFGTRFVHSGRYLLPVVPLLPIAAAYGLASLTRGRQKLWRAGAILLASTTALYAIAFAHIYTRENTRVAASAWIATRVPTDKIIANEHWDDPLPIRGPWIDPATGLGLPGAHRGLLVPVFDPDDPKKLRTLYNALSDADYYVLSSPRAWNTIGRLPDRFPLMTRFYDQLFAGWLGFVPAATFTSYPSLFGLQLHDLRAEEAFSVYDHPEVRIYRRTRPLDWKSFRNALCVQPTPAACR